MNVLGIHEKVNDGVDSRVGHGEPEEGEEDVLGVGVAGDVRVVVVDEVGVVGQPADAEHDQHHDEHDAHLPLVLDLVVGLLLLGLLADGLGPEHRAQVAVGDGQPHHGDHVGHQEEDQLVHVV